MRVDTDIKLDRWTQRNSTLRRHRAATHVPFELGNVDTVLRECQGSVAVL